MSKPNLPPLPTEVESVYVSVDGLSTYREARDCYYTMDQMYAYAEEAVRQALAAQVPLVDEPVCPRCGGTGEADSGGIHPWGAPALIPCECTVSASGHKPAPVDTSPGHSTVEQAAIRQALKGMQRWFGKWPEFIPADDKVADAAQAVAAMNAVLPETRDG